MAVARSFDAVEQSPLAPPPLSAQRQQREGVDVGASPLQRASSVVPAEVGVGMGYPRSLVDELDV